MTALGLVAWMAAPALGQKLAVRNYQAGDGLAHGVVISLHQDRKGYVWLATYEGLSRFDGYRFTNYGAADGLGRVVVNDVTSDREGQIWVALNGLGVARLVDRPVDDRTARKFTVHAIDADPRSPANAVNRLLFDTDNRLWCVTDAGLYRAREISTAEHGFERVVPGTLPYFNNAAFADSRGRLWFGVGPRVVRIAGGQITSSWPGHEREPPAGDIEPWQDIVSIIEDASGRILAAETTGVYELVETEPQSPRWRRWPLTVSRADGIRSMTSARDGGLWIGTAAGLIWYRDDSSRLYTTQNGLSSNRLRALLRDREDNLWIATEGSGLVKLSDEGVVTYPLPLGVPGPEVYRLALDRGHRIYATAGCAPRALVEIADEAVRAIAGTRLASSECFKSHLLRDTRGRTWYHTKAHVLQDSRGNWWFHTDRGLEFAPGPRLDFGRARPIGVREGFPEDFYTELYEDGDGRLWVVNGVSGNLYVAEPSSAAAGRAFRLVQRGLTNAEFLLRDRSGTLWIANDQRVWRLSNGSLTELEAGEGLPAIEPRSLFLDRRGRVWIGLRYHGVSMTADPEAARPRFVNYSTANGLASDAVWSIAEDSRGRIYFGTGRGLDQLDVDTGRVRHLSADAGVVGSVIEHVLEDRRGYIWVASDGGITRLDPRLMDREEHRPPVFVSGIRIGADRWPLPVTGARQVPLIELGASQNHVAIEFVGLSYRTDTRLRYRYQLEGVDAGWREPIEQREVNFAQLAPGRYRFRVSAITGRDVESVEPATVEFRILPPIYLRAWFLALSAAIAAAAAYGVYRYRVSRLLELANMRTHIATDLHDDIGANLTRIAILSELAQRRPRGEASADDARLVSIARIARESVASMSDIVWAINPQRDTVQDLIRKMREHAEEVCVGRGIELICHLPDSDQPLRIGMDVRRDLYLIFKEALNNAARHSGCSRVTVAFEVADSQLQLSISDNGAGFDPAAHRDGHGLASMERRARRTAATLHIDAAAGCGTSVRLTMPLRLR